MSETAKSSLQEWWQGSPLRYGFSCLILGFVSLYVVNKFSGLRETANSHWVVCNLFAALGFASGSIFNLIAHELGHAFAAKWIKCPIFTVELGIGKTISKFQLWGLPIHLRASPMSGIVRWGPLSLDRSRRQLATVTSGGMLSSLIVLLLFGTIAFIAWPLFELDNAPGYMASFASGVLGSTLFVFGSSWLPFAFNREGQMLSSDMLRLARLPWTPQAVLYEQVRIIQIQMDIQKWTDPAYASIEAAIENATRRPEDVRALFNAWYQITLKNDARAMTYARAVMERTPRDSSSRKLMLDVLISTGLDHNLLVAEPNGRALLEESYSFEPEGLGNLTTYGAGLVDFGEDTRGRKILDDVCKRSRSPINLSYAYTFVALTEKKAGNISLARSHAATARKHFPQCPILKRIEDLLEPLAK